MEQKDLIRYYTERINMMLETNAAHVINHALARKKCDCLEKEIDFEGCTQWDSFRRDAFREELKERCTKDEWAAFERGNVLPFKKAEFHRARIELIRLLLDEERSWEFKKWG